jgi:trans-2,3-dihydro-3-hydroxyanthranilate isomerase
MPSYRFVTVDVFTDRRFGGNQLAVFPDARGLTDAQMQALAFEFNLSETTFVLPPSDPANTARVRIFNRLAEMPFAGHPNVGTAFVLAREGRGRDGVLRFEELAGLVEVRVETGSDGAPTGASIAAPQPLSVGLALDAETVAPTAALAARDIVTTAHEPVVASVGMPFVIAEVTGDALTRAVPDLAAARRVAAAHPALNGRYALLMYAEDGAQLRARMFAPLSGTFEDPATGSANAALAALLTKLSGADRRSFTVVQGVEMGRPSLLRLEGERAADGHRATVAGGCIPVLSGEAEV